MRTQQGQKHTGFTVLYSVLVASLVLTIGLTIFQYCI